MNKVIQMRPTEWAKVVELCRELSLDPYKFSQMREGGKLIFDLCRLKMSGSFREEFLERYKI